MSDYKVLVGLNYPPNDTRAEIGDILPADFVSKASAKRLLRQGVIAEVEEGPSKGDAQSLADATADPGDPSTPDETETADSGEPSAPTEVNP
jgi:hypothetical protein